MRISDWSSDVCSSDLAVRRQEFDKQLQAAQAQGNQQRALPVQADMARLDLAYAGQETPYERQADETYGHIDVKDGSPSGMLRQEPAQRWAYRVGDTKCRARSEEHTSELQSLMRHSYSVFCLKK